MRLLTRKLLTLELTNNGAQSDTTSEHGGLGENKPAGATETKSEESMNNRDSQVICATLGGYALPEPSRYDEDSWDSDTMLLEWAPWFNYSTLAQE